MRAGLEPELRVEVCAGGIAIDERDALAELREIDGEVLRDEALADAAATSTNREEPSSSPHALQMIELDRGRRNTVRHRRPPPPPLVEFGLGARELSFASRARRRSP